MTFASKFRRPFFSLFIAFSGVIAATALTGCGKTESATVDDSPTVSVQRGSFKIQISEIGTLEAEKSTRVTNPLRGSGKLVKIVDEGTKVEKGDFIAQFDPTPYEERVENRRTQVADLKVRYSEALQSEALEKSRIERELDAAKYRVKLAILEMEDVVKGKGLITNIEMKARVDEAKTSYERELQRYQDVEELFKQDFVSAYDKTKQEIVMNEAKSAWELAQQKYDVRISFTYPTEKAKAEASLKKARSELSNYEKSFQRSLSREKSKVRNAKSGLDEEQKRLERDEKMLKATNVLAPASGFVIYGKTWDNGWRKIQAGDTVWRRRSFVTIPDLLSIAVKTRVREVDLHYIEKGQKATVTIDAFPDIALGGKVDGIGTLAVKDEETPTNEKYFSITVKLDNNDTRFRPGMTARVEVFVGEVKDALIIPVYAVFLEDGNTVCYVKDKEKGRVGRRVTIGRQNQDYAEVLEGLMEDEIVYLARPEGREKNKESSESSITMPNGGM